MELVVVLSALVVMNTRIQVHVQVVRHQLFLRMGHFVHPALVMHSLQQTRVHAYHAYKDMHQTLLKLVVILVLLVIIQRMEYVLTVLQAKSPMLELLCVYHVDVVMNHLLIKVDVITVNLGTSQEMDLFVNYVLEIMFPLK